MCFVINVRKPKNLGHLICLGHWFWIESSRISVFFFIKDILLHMCASCFELPPNANTMGRTDNYLTEVLHRYFEFEYTITTIWLSVPLFFFEFCFEHFSCENHGWLGNSVNDHNIKSFFFSLFLLFTYKSLFFYSEAGNRNSCARVEWNRQLSDKKFV